MKTQMLFWDISAGQKSQHDDHFSYPTKNILLLYGVMVKALDCGFIVCEFELQSHYHIHFHTNNIVKGMNPLILSAMG